ncbi:hypothetical protein ACTXJ3_18345 [Brachybacterium paraconglomeratum]|uniref:hypothetical protein n=1 Tax=Brachybacterium paraconglomeratum TaxID=173362 RepID=UPI003FD4548A
MPTTWHARLDWASTATTTTDALEPLLDELADHSPAGSVSRDGLHGSVMLFLESAQLEDAIADAIAIVRAALQNSVPTADLVGVDVRDGDALDRELEQPVFPGVVGYAEIAEIAGVSRQRARAFTKIDGFPAPVIVTAQGPLMARAAVERWLENRNTRPGRPATS